MGQGDGITLLMGNTLIGEKPNTGHTLLKVVAVMFPPVPTSVLYLIVSKNILSAADIRDHALGKVHLYSSKTKIAPVSNAPIFGYFATPRYKRGISKPTLNYPVGD